MVVSNFLTVFDGGGVVVTSCRSLCDGGGVVVSIFGHLLMEMVGCVNIGIFF